MLFRSRILDLNEALRISLESKINETIAGWFMEKTGNIARVGDKVNFSNWEFSIGEVEGLRIKKIRLKQIENFKNEEHKK